MSENESLSRRTASLSTPLVARIMITITEFVGSLALTRSAHSVPRPSPRLKMKSPTSAHPSQLEEVIDTLTARFVGVVVLTGVVRDVVRDLTVDREKHDTVAGDERMGHLPRLALRTTGSVRHLLTLEPEPPLGSTDVHELHWHPRQFRRVTLELDSHKRPRFGIVTRCVGVVEVRVAGLSVVCNRTFTHGLIRELADPQHLERHILLLIIRIHNARCGGRLHDVDLREQQPPVALDGTAGYHHGREPAVSELVAHADVRHLRPRQVTQRPEAVLESAGRDRGVLHQQ